MNKKILLILLGVILTLTLSVMKPSRAYADDGFLGGLQDLVGVRETEQRQECYEQDYLDGYVAQPVVLRSDDEFDEDATTSENIQAVINRTNTVDWSIGSRSLLDSVHLLLTRFGTAGGAVAVAIGLVFMWWGVRKTLDVIMSAYRRGRLKI